MILHLVHDDKVIPRMISLFEQYNPHNNYFVCVSCKNKKSLRFLSDNPNIIMAYSKEETVIDWKTIDKICIHYFDLHKAYYLYIYNFFRQLKNKTIIWFMWGGDIYSRLERYGFKILSDNNSFLTINTLKAQRSIKDFMVHCFWDVYGCVISYVAKYFFQTTVNYVVSSENEYELFKKYYTFKNCIGVLPFTYYSIEDTLGELVDKEVSGNAVIIGHNAGASCNHEYILDFIKDVDFNQRMIILPMNYGIHPSYSKIIECKYNDVFSNVQYLNNFLPLNEYNSIMLSASTFIYGNFRQEAWGNILVALYLGGKVYLSINSPLRIWCENLGFIFFILEDIAKTYNISLTDEDKKHNRKIAFENFSRKQNEDNIKRICIL